MKAFLVFYFFILLRIYGNILIFMLSSWVWGTLKHCLRKQLREGSETVYLSEHVALYVLKIFKIDA